MENELFTRDGELYAKQPLVDGKGKPYFVRQNPCSRCGGRGGADKWAYTGWTCFQCGGGKLGKTEKVRLYTQEQIAKLNATREKRRVKIEANRALEAAAREAERSARREKFLAEHDAYFGSILDVCGNDCAAAEIIATATSLAALSDKQREALDRMAAEAKRKAATQFVGTVGERTVFDCTIRRILDWSRTDCFPRIYRYCHIMHDANGNVVKYIGSAYLGAEGETTSFKATIEAHEVYKGERQTVVSRPKLIEKAIDSQSA